MQENFDEEITYIGERQVWGGRQFFGLRQKDRRQHTYLIGKTGSGKTTLLRNLLLQDIQAGRGIGLIDPHGDLASDILDYIPPNRTDDVVYFNPADLDHPVSFNLIHNSNNDDRHRIASGIVGAFKSIWRDFWGPRLEYILYAAVAALLECQNTTLMGIQRMLIDTGYRAWVVRQVTDPAVRSFWEGEFAGYEPRFLREAVAPIQNKVGQLLMSSPIRNILGQVRNRIDVPFIMNNRRIFIANLSKGILGEDKANLLGAILVTQFHQAAMARAILREQDRTNFYLFVDEFHNYATDAFASILSEARKYGLCLTLAHQYTDQLHPDIRHAVFGNVGTLVAFRVGEKDAAVLSHEFGGAYDPGLFSSLADHEICVKLLNEGETEAPFLGTTLPPLPLRHGRRELLIRHARERYTESRRVVENKIRRWMGGNFTGG